MYTRKNLYCQTTIDVKSVNSSWNVVFSLSFFSVYILSCLSRIQFLQLHRPKAIWRFRFQHVIGVKPIQKESVIQSQIFTCYLLLSSYANPALGHVHPESHDLRIWIIMLSSSSSSSSSASSSSTFLLSRTTMEMSLRALLCHPWLIMYCNVWHRVMFIL